jgi:hypothetical protein
MRKRSVLGHTNADYALEKSKIIIWMRWPEPLPMRESFPLKFLRENLRRNATSRPSKRTLSDLFKKNSISGI